MSVATIVTPSISPTSLERSSSHTMNVTSKSISVAAVVAVKIITQIIQ